MTVAVWRSVHAGATIVVGLLGLAHSVLTFVFYPRWTAGAAWFLGAGLGLVLLASMNWVLLRDGATGPASGVIRTANCFYAAFGIGAAWAVPQPQAFAVVAGLVVQAVAGLRTLRS